MKNLILLLSLYVFSANAEQLKIAVLDSGIDLNFSKTLPLCKEHFDAVDSLLVLPEEEMENKHGTNIAGLIDLQIEKKKSYCLMIIKVFKKSYNEHTGKTFVRTNIGRGVDFAVKNGANVINISGGGIGEISYESYTVKMALNKNVKIIAAAGNEGRLLTRNPKSSLQVAFYPALSDDRVIVVGSTDGVKKLKTSNYGDHVDVWEKGKDLQAGGVTLTGTSQATAVVTGKLVNKLLNERKSVK